MAPGKSCLHVRTLQVALLLLPQVHFVQLLQMLRHHCPVFLPGEFHGQRSLVSYSPWGRKESDMTVAKDNNKFLEERKQEALKRAEYQVLSEGTPLRSKTTLKKSIKGPGVVHLSTTEHKSDGGRGKGGLPATLSPAEEEKAKGPHEKIGRASCRERV